MDEETKLVVDAGRRYIEIIKNDPVLPLDYTEQTLENVQEWIASLGESETSDAYRAKAEAGFAVYLGDMIKKISPDFNFKAVYINRMLDEIQLVNNEGRVFYLLSWVKKCVASPQEESVVLEYTKVSESLQGN